MILILGGTTEGRKAVSTVDETGQPYYYSTKEANQKIDCKNGIRLTGAMDIDTMTSFCREKGIRLIVDAAHPFAELLHQTVAEVASRLSLPVVRYERIYPPRNSEVVWCDSYADAVRKLEDDGITFLLALTGVQTITNLKAYWQKYHCVFRVLDQQSSLELAERQGVARKNIVFYRPGEEEALLYRVKPQAVLTKESGESGGFSEKLAAAKKMNIPIYAVKRPVLPSTFIVVTGYFGLRKQIERFVPGFFSLRSGYTTGSCATAAAKAALLALLTGSPQKNVTFTLPDDEEMTLPVSETLIEKDAATATVVKDSGDDPDVTNGCKICVTVALGKEPGIRFLQGEGVGKVTLPGLGLEVGGPAINRIPRQMIIHELSSLYDGGLDVTISVPGGEALAARTFNPKLGVVGGISIIGTSGVVMPFSSEAFVEAIRREIEVCRALSPDRLVINSGGKSERFIKKEYPELPDQAFVHYGNFIGETLKIAADLRIPNVTMGIMIGKAVKLAEGFLDTHSKKTVMNKDFLEQVAGESGCTPQASDVIREMTLARELWTRLSVSDKDRLFPALLRLCLHHCMPLLPESHLTILLIDEDGNIPYRLESSHPS